MAKEKLKVGFALHGIKTEQFAILEENYSSKKDVQLATNLQFKLDQSSQQIGVFLGFEFVQGKSIFIKILVSCHFKINDESWSGFIDSKKNKLVVSKGFLAHIAMITMGTIRGVLFAKTEGTPLSKYIIPTMNVTELVNEDGVFDLKKE